MGLLSRAWQQEAHSTAGNTTTSEGARAGAEHIEEVRRARSRSFWHLAKLKQRGAEWEELEQAMTLASREEKSLEAEWEALKVERRARAAGGRLALNMRLKKRRRSVSPGRSDLSAMHAVAATAAFEAARAQASDTEGEAGDEEAAAGAGASLRKGFSPDARLRTGSGINEVRTMSSPAPMSASPSL